MAESSFVGKQPEPHSTGEIMRVLDNIVENVSGVSVRAERVRQGVTKLHVDKVGSEPYQFVYPNNDDVELPVVLGKNINI